MNHKSRTFLKKSTGCVLAAGGVLTTMNTFGAESVLMGPPPTAIQPVSVQEDSTNNEMSVFMPSYDNRDTSLPEPFKFGPVVIRPHPYYHFYYATGIQSSTNNSASSVIQEISPGVTVDFGRHWSLDYTPTFRLYSSSAFKNSVDHSATLSGGTRYDDWVFNFSQSFAQSDSTLAETASQTAQQTYGTSFSALRQLNDKMYEESDISQAFNYVSGQQDSKTWSLTEWLNYEFNKRLIVGAGVGGGYVTIQPDGGGSNGNPDQSYENMNARVQWRATDKLGMTLTAGFEDRQTLAAGSSDELNPTFGASIDYSPFKQTQISLSAGRTISSSDYYIIAQSTENTTVGVSLNQRILEVYNLSVSAGYTQTQYTTALGPLSDIRTDDIYNFTVRFGRSFLKRGNVALTYQYSDDHSNQAGFSYHSNQIGFEVGFTY